MKNKSKFIKLFEDFIRTEEELKSKKSKDLKDPEPHSKEEIEKIKSDERSNRRFQDEPIDKDFDRDKDSQDEDDLIEEFKKHFSKRG